MSDIGSVVPMERRSAESRSAWRDAQAEFARWGAVIRRFAPGVPVLGVSSLHPRHPLLADQLEGIEALSAPTGRQGWPLLMRIGARWLRCVVFAAREALRALILQLRLGRRLRLLTREPATVLVKTWRFGHGPLAGRPDFYFGTLAADLAQRGVSCVVLCGDGMDRHDLRFAREVIESTAVRAVPELMLVPWWAPLVVVWKQLVAGMRLWSLAHRAQDPRRRLVCGRTALGCVETGTIRNSMYFYIGRTAVRRWRARVLVTLYEGQPWEQPLWQGAKAADAGCVIVGYQHTVVMPHASLLLSPPRGVRPGVRPDIVLCLGEETRRMLEPGHAKSGTRFVTFGSYRIRPGEEPPCAPRPQRRTVLVLPEGQVAEAQLLFNAAIRLAALLPDHRFIFRCHPMLPFEVVRPQLDAAYGRLANLELSMRRTLQEDFRRSSVVLYRGSSSVLYAILHGLKPIYLHQPGRPEIDPLFRLREWRERVETDDELAAALQGYAQTSEEASAGEWRPAAGYAGAYTHPVEPQAVDRLLAEVRLNGLKRASPCAA